MTEPDDNKFSLPDEAEPSERRIPLGAIVTTVVILLVAVAAWLFHGSSTRQAEVVAALERELDTDKAALDAQKEKVVQLTQQLESLKAAIQVGTVKNRKEATQQYNEIVRQQNSEREKWMAMANEYNRKVEKYQAAQ